MKSLVLAVLVGVALVLSLIGSILVASNVSATEGEGVHIRGIGNSGNTFGFHWASRAARRIEALGIAAEVTDDTVRSVFKAMLARAQEGDPEAAAVVFEVVARRQAQARAASGGKK
jgi:hypothetical protein